MNNFYIPEFSFVSNHTKKNKKTSFVQLNSIPICIELSLSINTISLEEKMVERN